MIQHFFRILFFSAFFSLFFFSAVFAANSTTSSTVGSATSLTAGPTMREELLFSVVQIVAVSEEGDAFLGSGSTIRSDGLLLTNYHVAVDEKTEEPYSSISLCYSISQYQAPKCLATGKVVASNKAFDLALVLPDKKIGKDGRPTKTGFQKFWKQTGRKFYTAPFKNTSRSKLPEILDPITAWGYPVLGGSTVTVTSGFVSGFGSLEEGKDALVRFIKTDTEISPGNSGGAAFNQSYAFIGVPTRAAPGQLGFVVPVQTIVEWFEELDSQGAIQMDSIESLDPRRVSFSDISSDENFHDLVLVLNHLGIMKGYSDGTFRPRQLMTRAEAVKIVLRAKRVIDPPEISDCKIQNPQAWYRQEVCYARSIDLIGKDWISGKIDPDKNITQEEFADLLQKAFGVILDPVNPSGFVTRGKAAREIFQLFF